MESVWENDEHNDEHDGMDDDGETYEKGQGEGTHPARCGDGSYKYRNKRPYPTIADGRLFSHYGVTW